MRDHAQSLCDCVCVCVCKRDSFSSKLVLHFRQARFEFLRLFLLADFRLAGLATAPDAFDRGFYRRPNKKAAEQPESVKFETGLSRSQSFGNRVVLYYTFSRDNFARTAPSFNEGKLSRHQWREISAWEIPVKRFPWPDETSLIAKWARKFRQINRERRSIKELDRVFIPTERQENLAIQGNAGRTKSCTCATTYRSRHTGAITLNAAELRGIRAARKSA